MSEDNIRKLLGKEPVNIFEEIDRLDEDPTYGTGITQVGPRSHGRPGNYKTKNAVLHEGVEPLRRADRILGMKKRSSPSDT